MRHLPETVQRPTRIGLSAINLFLGITAGGGGIGLLTGWIAPGNALLEGSIFASYVVPGLSLLVLVGGSALVAAGLVWRRAGWGPAAAAIAAAAILIFEGVEYAVIGYHWLQVAYVAIGVAIGLLAALLWWAERQPEAGRLASARPAAA